MRLIISDTGPINYLVLIGHIDILPVLFEKIIMPSAVLDELTGPDAPPSVKGVDRKPAALDGGSENTRPFFR